MEVVVIIILVAMLNWAFSSTINVYAESKIGELQNIEQTAANELTKVEINFLESIKKTHKLLSSKKA